MKISIFGLGYVGCVSAAILAKQGHQVIGVDVNQDKINIINSGRSPIIEDFVNDYIASAVKNQLMRATSDSKSAVLDSSVSIVCVGTPSADDGSTSLIYIKKVISEIAEALRNKTEPHTVIIRSTIPPETMEKVVIPILREAKNDVGICFNPEFLREGCAVKDYNNPPYVIVAVNNENTENVLREIYQNIEAEFIVTDFKTAEILKVVNNIFHALKIVFANEVGRFSTAHHLDAKEIMKLVCKDKKLNISEKYLKPGHAYGGSCLPKDLRSFVYMARQKNIELPVIENISSSNEFQINHTIKKINNHGSKKLGFVGLSFKPGTDDLRESPSVRLVEHFIGKGYDISIYDPHVKLSQLMGANKKFIEEQIPHISQLLCENIGTVFNKSDIIVTTRDEDFEQHLNENHHLIDLR